MIGSALAAIILARGVGRAKDANVELIVSRLELAAESGVHRVLFDFVGRREAGRGNSAEGLRQVQIDGFKVDIQAQFSDGLVGLRNARKEHLQKVLAAAFGPRASLAARSLSKVGPTSISSYADLYSLEGIGPDGVACLIPYVTLHGGNDVPVAEHAPSRLKSLLGLKKNATTGAIQGEISSLAGSVIRIQAWASNGEYRSRPLLAEALLTGRLDEPVWILEWLWLPKTAGTPEWSPCL